MNNYIDYNTIISGMRNPLINEIEKNKKSIKKLNEAILDLMYQKKLYIEETLRKASKLTHITIFPISNWKILEEFGEFGFESHTMRECVKRVRDIFFDDTDEDYRKYDCTNIHENNSFDGDDLAFSFSNGEKEFDIIFPNNVKDRVRDCFEHDYISGTIYITFEPNQHSKVAYGASYKFSEIKEFIRKIVKENGYPKNDYSDEKYKSSFKYLSEEFYEMLGSSSIRDDYNDET